ERDDSYSPERVSEGPTKARADEPATPVLVATPKSLKGAAPSEKAVPAASPVTRPGSLPSTTLPKLMPSEWGEMRSTRPVWMAAPSVDATRYQSPDRSSGAAVLEGRLMELDEEVRALRLENASLRAELEILRRTSPARGRSGGGCPPEHHPRPPSRGRS
ncbi:hypothetical protein FOZ62_021274, partial [Perkinsus olseni]